MSVLGGSLRGISLITITKDAMISKAGNTGKVGMRVLARGITFEENMQLASISQGNPKHQRGNADILSIW
jgi:hypothetical protein